MPIIAPGDSTDVKLNKAREHFLEQVSRHNARRRAMEKAFAFSSGDQWEAEAKQTLENEGRPVLTFNLISPLLREICGANEDQRRQAKVMPVGMEDTPTSGVINHLHERVANESTVRLKRKEANVFDKGLKCGIGVAFLDAFPDPEMPNEVKVTLEAIQPTEVIFDLDANQPNCEDAKHVYWHRWLTEAEFRTHYPDHGEEWEELSAQLEAEVGPELATDLDHLHGLTELQRGMLMDERFFNRREKKLRVIHLEYQAPKKVYLAWDPRPDAMYPNRARGFVPVERSTYSALKKSGLTPVNTSMSWEWRWFEFTGHTILFDGPQPLPLKRPQLFAFTCYNDDITGEPYGVVRDLMDPQAEVNKRYSTDLLMRMQGAVPGMIADDEAFADTTPAVEAKIREPGFVLFKKPGAEVNFRDPPKIPLGADTEGAKTLLQQIAGMSLDPMQGPNVQEAVGVALLRYRKSLMAIGPVVGNFRAFQIDLLDALVKVVLLTFGDEQIERMMGEQNRYRVQNGVVYDIQEHTQIILSELRAIRWNIELETAAANTTQQLLLLQMLLEMHAKGIPIDAEVVVEMLPISKDEREQLKAYIRETKQQGAQLTAAQQQASREQLQAILKTEALKSAAKVKGDEERVALDEQKAMLDFVAKMVKAYGDGSETARKKMRDLMDLFSKFAELQIDDRRTVMNQGVTVGANAGRAAIPRTTPPAPGALIEQPTEAAAS